MKSKRSTHGLTDVTVDGAGLFAITFATAYPALVYFNATVLTASATLGYVTTMSLANYVAGTGVLTFQLAKVDTASATAGTLATSQMVDNDWICVDVVFTQAASDAVVGPL